MTTAFQQLKTEPLKEGQPVCFFYTDPAEWTPGTIQTIDEDGIWIAFRDHWQHLDFLRRVERKYIVPFSTEAMCHLLDDHDAAIHALTAERPSQ